MSLELVRLQGVSSERECCERDLLALPHKSLALPGRVKASAQAPWSDGWFLAVRRRQGRYLAGCHVQPRVVPIKSYRVLRAQYVQPPDDEQVSAVMARGLADFILSDDHNLRLNVRVFARDAALRQRFGQALLGAGFQPSDPDDYTNTLTIDLQPDEDAILSSLSSSARRNVRSLKKYPVEIRDITDTALISRLDQLYDESIRRTGGRSGRPDWKPWIEMGLRAPDLVRFAGLFRTDQTGPGSLLAFALGLNHGDRCEYNFGASTRNTDLKVPQAYALLWHLVLWGKQNGAAWFDMGGVTQGSNGEKADALGGISDFKRFFSKTEVQIAEEWVLHARSFRATIARNANRVLRTVREHFDGWPLQNRGLAPTNDQNA